MASRCVLSFIGTLLSKVAKMQLRAGRATLCHQLSNGWKSRELREMFGVGKHLALALENSSQRSAIQIHRGSLPKRRAGSSMPPIENVKFPVLHQLQRTSNLRKTMPESTSILSNSGTDFMTVPPALAWQNPSTALHTSAVWYQLRSQENISPADREIPRTPE